MQTTSFFRHILQGCSLYGVFFSLLLSITAHVTEHMPLACYYYDKKDSSQNSSMLHAGLPWLWAIDENGDHIYLRGKTKDGFFHVTGITTQQEGFLGSSVSETHENSTKHAKSFCEYALRKTFPDNHQQKSILNMVVKASFLSISKVAPVFKNGTSKNSINQMVIVGDSLSDQANLKSWLRLMPADPYFGGRFTNGRNWVDYFQEMTDVAVQNFATGGSVTNGGMKLDKHRCKIAEEVKQIAHSTFSGNVEEEISRYRDEYLVDGRVGDPDSTLYTILIGGNDYLALLNSETDINTFIDNPDDSEAGSNAINEQVTKNIATHLYAFAELGARRILVINLPNFGIIPKLLETENYHRGFIESSAARMVRLSQRLTEITQNHNKLLKERVDAFQRKFPEIKIVYGDIYSGLQNMLLGRHVIKSTTYFNYELDANFINSFSYGTNNVLINKACYTGEVCVAPNKALFWDYVHPTTYGHCLLAAGIHRRLSQEGLFGKTTISDYLRLCRPELLW